MNAKKLLLIAFFLFIVFVKLFFIINFMMHNDFSKQTLLTNGDAGHYYQIAENIHEFHTFSDNHSNIASESAAWRPPFWPFLLSVFLLISDNPLSLTIIKTIVEVGFILLLTFYIKRRYTGYYGLLFFVLLIEPQYLKYSISLLSESITAILILALSVLFMQLHKHKKHRILFPILAGITVLCHPVSVFFISALFFIYLLYNWKSNRKTSLFHGVLFLLIFISWPIRNEQTFQKGYFLTASQGATFAKGWNETVATDFNNVDGDLADESLNLKYVSKSAQQQYVSSVLNLSELYKEGTKNYIKSLSLKQKTAIIFKKLQSNFNPFPEKPKDGFFEKIAIIFRLCYLLLFMQLVVRLIKWRKFHFDNNVDKAYLLTLCVFLGQIVIASYIYTGLRFNAIYSLCLLFCFLTINQENSKKIARQLLFKLS